ncbi:hypothetical protein [Parahaliea aestuarii]|uniref:Uncharacterized protein n=1 Tax=Parahaliea aestuarii TaxID=1852021 RepID=A0A5C9A6C7_9GAMM|nr:hypothetical protein [Parahaliea aestuarii]TXS95107.1 hypothetical protein FVW59_04205 [Parahaliea aestuarii]
MNNEGNGGTPLVFRHGLLFGILFSAATILWVLHVQLGKESLASLFAATLISIVALHFLCMCAFDSAYQRGILNPVATSAPGSNKPYAFILPAVLTSCFLVSARTHYLETGTQDFVNLTGAGIGLVMLILFDANIYRRETKSGRATTPT